MSILNMDSFVPSLWLVSMIGLGASEHVWWAGLAMGTTTECQRGREVTVSHRERMAGGLVCQWDWSSRVRGDGWSSRVRCDGWHAGGIAQHVAYSDDSTQHVQT